MRRQAQEDQSASGLAAEVAVAPSPPNDGESRESPLSVARKWLPWCLALIFVMTIGWTALVASEEVSNGNHTSLRQIAIAVVYKAAPAVPFIVIYAIMTTSVVDTLGGSVVVTAQYLRNKFVKPLIERHKAEGRAEGRVEGRAEGRVEGRAEGRVEGRAEGVVEGEANERRRWSEWNRRRMDAAAASVPFDEPPPGELSGETRDGDQTLA